jgi:hypothetical protein
VSQYRHDRFAKLYVKALYKTKGNVRENIPVRRDEDLAIDLLFVADAQSPAWQTEDLGWFDKLMAVHPTIIVEHYSAYLSLNHLDQELTTEEKAIMRTLEQIDTLFDVEIPAAERRGEEHGLKLGTQQGKLQTINLLVQAKFGDQPEREAILTRMAGLDETQLNAIATEIFQWQTLADVLAWLDRLES